MICHQGNVNVDLGCLEIDATVVPIRLQKLQLRDVNVIPLTEAMILEFLNISFKFL